MLRSTLGLLTLVVPAHALAAPEQVTLSSDVAVERIVADGSGSPKVKLEAPNVVTPGDKLVFTVAYANKSGSPANDFVVTNAVPKAVAFTGDQTSGALMSIDGGKSWGALSSLAVKAADGSSRAALPSDVTHIRWSFKKAIPSGETGKLSFRAVVR